MKYVVGKNQNDTQIAGVSGLHVPLNDLTEYKNLNRALFCFVLIQVTKFWDLTEFYNITNIFMFGAMLKYLQVNVHV